LASGLSAGPHVRKVRGTLGDSRAVVELGLEPRSVPKKQEKWVISKEAGYPASDSPPPIPTLLRLSSPVLKE
jgi:hypothetical protein